MKKFLADILSIALIYCGTVFGAGFASGQEIVTFFSVYNWCGVLVSVIIGFLFSLFGFKICSDSWHYNFESAGEYFEFLFPKIVSRILNFICMSFLVVSFCIMIAGCGALFLEQFSLRPVAGSLFSLFLCYLIIKNRVNGLAWFNSAVTPFMFFGVVVLAILCISKGNINFQRLESKEISGSLISGILYLSYNLVSATAVLVPCAKLSKTRCGAGIGGVVGGFLIFLPLVLLAVSLSLFPEYINTQLPFFDLVCKNYPGLSLFCGLILYCAMLTTAAASGVSVVAKVSARYSGKASLMLCIAAFFVSFVPFDTLVKSMYSIFGFCGLLLIGGILKSFFRNKKK